MVLFLGKPDWMTKFYIQFLIILDKFLISISTLIFFFLFNNYIIFNILSYISYIFIYNFTTTISYYYSLLYPIIVFLEAWMWSWPSPCNSCLL